MSSRSGSFKIVRQTDYGSQTLFKSDSLEDIAQFVEAKTNGEVNDDGT